MTEQGKVSQDRRYSSRVIAKLDCSVEYGNESYDGVVVDLSPQGAFISAPILPPVNAEIRVRINSNHLMRELALKGKVLRGSEVMTDYGKRGRFAVYFDDTPLDLIILIGKLYNS